MKWKQELLYVKRDAHGVIVAIQEEVPADFKTEDQKQESQEEKRYRVIGD